MPDRRPATGPRQPDGHKTASSPIRARILVVACAVVLGLVLVVALAGRDGEQTPPTYEDLGAFPVLDRARQPVFEQISASLATIHATGSLAGVGPWPDPGCWGSISSGRPVITLAWNNGRDTGEWLQIRPNPSFPLGYDPATARSGSDYNQSGIDFAALTRFNMFCKLMPDGYVWFVDYEWPPDLAP